MIRQHRNTNAAIETEAIEAAGATEKTDIIFRKITNTIMTIYVLFYLCIFPLAMHNVYFDIVSFRFKLFWIPTDILGVVMLLIIFIYALAKNKEHPGYIKHSINEFSVKKWWKDLHTVDKVFAGLILIYILSTLLAEHQYEAFWGNRGRYNGCCLWLSYFIVYILIRKFYHFNKKHSYCYMLMGCLPCIWGIVNFFLIHPFGTMNQVDIEHYQYIFVSSVGNINTYTNMVAILMGVSTTYFIISENKLELAISGITMIISMFAIVMGLSDNAVLSSLAIFIALPFISWKESKNIMRYMIAAFTFCVAISITYLLSVHFSTMLNWFNMSVFAILAEYKLTYIAAAFFAFLAVLIIVKRKSITNNVIMNLVKAWKLILIAGTVVVIFLLVDANLGSNPEKYGTLQNILCFSDDWGTGRGFNWKMAVDYYIHDAGIKDKLIGYGPDTYYIITMDHFLKLMHTAGYGWFDEAHNEYLNYLLTIGLIGLVLYCAFIVKCIKTMNKHEGAIPFAIGTLAYAVQAFVNIAAPITTPIYMLVMFVGTSYAVKSNSDSMQKQFMK